ncbi:MAG TPA: hypothetical protein VH817_07030 [Thermoleophilaceae bacterium]|jgi:hypothetical protein
MTATIEQQPDRLTFDEYAERIAGGETVSPPPMEESAGRRPRWLVGVLGGTDQKGRWRLGRRLRIVAVLGGVDLDLGQAQPEAPESLITVFAVFGGANLTAPPGVPIELTGASLLGGKSDKRPPGPRMPGCPVVRVRVFSLFGGVSVEARKSD